MNYSVEWAVKQVNPDFLFFWGHQPSRDGSIIKTCMSQWWPAVFSEEGVTYPTAEHYMMAGKAKLFGDTAIFEKILTKTSPKDVKDLGRQIQHFDAAVWNKEKYQLVKRGNYLKFSQDQRLHDFLVNTGNKILAEASPVDAIWGIGLAEEDPKAKDPAQWRGEDLLGFVLMEVRDELKNKLK